MHIGSHLPQVLESASISAPRVPVISNVTAGPFPSDPSAIRDLLGRQLVEPVRWEDTLTALLAAQPAAAAGGGLMWQGCSGLYELGPGQQIKAMVRRISQAAWKEFTNVQAV